MEILTKLILALGQAAIIGLFTYLVLRRHERNRERQVHGILGYELAQLLYWLWFFQRAGEEVRKQLDQKDNDLNPWIAANIASFRDQPRGRNLAESVTIPVTGREVIERLGDLPFQLSEWHWRARQIEQSVQTIYTLLPVASAKVSSAMLAPISAVRVNAIDALYQLHSAAAACEQLQHAAVTGEDWTSSEDLRLLLRCVDGGIISVWR
jgi:hypothetical protein